MDPNVQNAQTKRDDATEIETTAATLRADGNEEAAINLEEQALNLRAEADQEELDAQAKAEQEKADIDRKYGLA